MPIATGSTAEIQTWIETNRVRVFTAVLDNADDYFAADFTGNVAIVVGNEADGLSDQWQE